MFNLYYHRFLVMQDFTLGLKNIGLFAIMIKIELETGGSVWKILKKAGDKVFAGEVLFILEVMKMEVPYEAPASGEIVEIWFNEGDPVEEGQIAAEIQVS